MERLLWRGRQRCECRGNRGICCPGNRGRVGSLGCAQRGGLDAITITNNGTPPQNLPLACTRFATSKLVEVDDLKSIQTFGFSGKVLVSASMMARVGITSSVRPRNKNAAVNADGGECSS